MRVNKNLLAWSRLIHVYVSMALLTLMIFFAVTGITLNHPSWFDDSQAQSEVIEGEVAQALLVPEQQGALVDFLYQQHLLQGNRLLIERDEQELFLSSKGPGTHLSVTIDLTTGELFKEQVDYGVWARLNDLHKGRNSGALWRFIIDLSAGLMMLFSLTGLILALVQRRVNKTMSVAGLSSLLVLLCYFIYV